MTAVRVVVTGPTFPNEAMSAYPEKCWLPVIGPTSWALRRRLHMAIEEYGTDFKLDSNALIKALGLGGAWGANSPLKHAFERLSNFGLIFWDIDTGPDPIAYVPRGVPDVPDTQYRKYPPHDLRAGRAGTIGS